MPTQLPRQRLSQSAEAARPVRRPACGLLTRSRAAFAAQDDACVDDRLAAFAPRRGHSAIELSNVSMLASSVACVTAVPAAVVPAPDMSAVHPSKALAPSPV